MEIPRFLASPDSGPYTQPGFKINPNLSTFAEYWQSLDPSERRAIKQYMAIVNADTNLWQEIYKRIDIAKSWERDPRGIGSCDMSDKSITEGLVTPFKADLIQLRDRRNNETPLMGKKGGCPHHRPGVGCVLGGLKTPLCLDYIDLFVKPAIEARFGICLMPVEPYLLHVGLAGVDQSIIPWEFHPEVNDEFTRKTVASITAVTDYIKTFPILSPQTVSGKQQLAIFSSQ